MEIKVQAVTTEHITVYLSGLDENYDRADRYVDWYLYPEATKRGRSTIGKNATTSETFAFGGLSEGTSYQIYGLVYWTDGSTGAWDNKQTELLTVTTTSSSKITKWYWTSSNGSATTSETQKAHTAVKNNGYVKDFSYRVWNDLVDKLNEYITKYHENRWSGVILSLSNTKMTESDRTLTADRFNSLRHEMNYACSTNYPMANTGDEVKGSYFTEITARLNDEIEFANSQL